MKKTVVAIVVVMLGLFIYLKPNSQNNKPMVDLYPWQITVENTGKTRVFGITLNETMLKKVDEILKVAPVIALYETKVKNEDKNKLSLEAYYKNISLGGLIGSFVLAVDAPIDILNKIKIGSRKQKRTKTNEVKYLLDKPTSESVKKFTIKNIIYIPTAQLDEETIIERFGTPTHKIKLKTKEAGWHYLYSEKGLDLIFKEEGKEVLQYVLPKNFNLLLEPLQTH